MSLPSRDILIVSGAAEVIVTSMVGTFTPDTTKISPTAALILKLPLPSAEVPVVVFLIRIVAPLTG